MPVFDVRIDGQRRHAEVALAPSRAVVPVSGGTTEPRTTPSIARSSIRLVREQPVDEQAELVGRPLAQRLQAPALRRASSPSNTPSTMFVLPTSIASSMDRFSQVPGSGQFAGDDALDAGRRRRTSSAPRSSMPAVTPDCAPAGVVHDTRAPRRAGRARAPRVENSIEPAVEQIVVAPRQRGERLGEQRRAIDRAAQLGLERRRAVGAARADTPSARR